MHRFPQCTVILKIFQNSVIHISCNHNDEILKLSSIKVSWVISTIWRNYYYFLHNWTEFVFETQPITFEIIGTKFAKATYQTIYHLHIFTFIVCVHLVTLASLWRQKGVAMHVTHETMHRFSTMHDSSLPTSDIGLQILALLCIKTN